MSCDRGQLITTEAIMAFVVFNLVLVSAFVVWNTTTMKIVQSETLYEMDVVSNDAVEKLIRTSGLPADWQGEAADNISSIGLVDESRVLAQGKVLRFIGLMEDQTSSNESDNPCYDPMDADTHNITKYECNKHLVGVGGYDFHLAVKYLNGTSLLLGGKNCSTGRAPGDEDYLVSVERSAVLEDELVKVLFSLWYSR